MSKSKRQALRQQVFIDQRGRCYYCGLDMWLYARKELTEPFGLTDPQAKRLQCTVEHLVPRSEGGGNSRGNVVAACAHCNHTRHKRAIPPRPEVFRADIHKRLAKGSWHHPDVLRRLFGRTVPGILCSLKVYGSSSM